MSDYLYVLISDTYSSPSNKPGTSPDANRAFILSKNATDKTLDSSNIKEVNEKHLSLECLLLSDTSFPVIPTSYIIQLHY